MVQIIVRILFGGIMFGLFAVLVTEILGLSISPVNAALVGTGMGALFGALSPIRLGAI